jgi:hypothetical protein
MALGSHTNILKQENLLSATSIAMDSDDDMYEDNTLWDSQGMLDDAELAALVIEGDAGPRYVSFISQSHQMMKTNDLLYLYSISITTSTTEPTLPVPPASAIASPTSTILPITNHHEPPPPPTAFGDDELRRMTNTAPPRE